MKDLGFDRDQIGNLIARLEGVGKEPKVKRESKFRPGDPVELLIDAPGIGHPVGTILFQDPVDGSYKVDFNGLQLWFSELELLPAEAGN